MISSKFDISLIFISIDIIMDLYRNFNKENHIQMISSKFDISLIFISRNNSNIIIDSIYIGILTKLTSISWKFDISSIFIQRNREMSRILLSIYIGTERINMYRKKKSWVSNSDVNRFRSRVFGATLVNSVVTR